MHALPSGLRESIGPPRFGRSPCRTGRRAYRLRLQAYPSACPPGDQSVRGGVAWHAVRCLDHRLPEPPSGCRRAASGVWVAQSRIPHGAPEGVRWFDVDLPQVIALRRQLYSESETYRMVGSSVTDPGWIDELPAGGPVLIVAEGLLMYLTPADVTELLHRLVDRFDTGELLADLLSEWGPRLSRVFSSGIIKWGTRDGSEITRWEPRLRLIEEHLRHVRVRQDSAYPTAIAVPHALRHPGDSKLRPDLPIRVLDSSTSPGDGSGPRYPLRVSRTRSTQRGPWQMSSAPRASESHD